MMSLFQDAAMTSFHSEKRCHLVSAHASCAWHVCSNVIQLLIHSTYIRNCFSKLIVMLPSSA